MPEKQLPKSINLLEPVNEPEDVWTKAYIWITGAGRVLLVLVELVVLGVFGARFILDKRNNDLSDDIQDQVDTLSRPDMRKKESEYRQIHGYLSDIKTIKSEQNLNSERFSEILDNLPSNLEMKTISINNTNVSLSLIASNFKDISQYTSYLNRNYEEVTVSLNKDKDDQNTEEVTVIEDVEDLEELQEENNGSVIELSISFKFKTEDGNA